LHFALGRTARQDAVTALTGERYGGRPDGRLADARVALEQERRRTACDGVEKRLEERKLVRSADRMRPFRLEHRHVCILIRGRAFVKIGCR
jgi:hypothetical protein